MDYLVNRLTHLQISRRAGHLAATVSMDAYFQHWHSKQLSNYAKNQYGQFRSRGIKLITNAIYRPIVDLVVGIAFGCSGLLVEPYKGATMSGKIGFIEGVCRGILGIPLKPIVGIFDAFAHLSESIHVSVLLNDAILISLKVLIILRHIP